MGTSKSLPMGSGGAWSSLKGDITSHFSGSRPVTAASVVRDTVRASGGFGAGGRGSRGGGGGGGGGSAGGGGSGGRVGPVVGGLGGFGAAVRESGLDQALERLGLGDLAGKSPVEVVAAVAEHLAQTVEGPDGALLEDALREAILEASALQAGDDQYSDLEAGLAEFLGRNGAEGLVEIFLCRFVFDAVWSTIEGHVLSRATDQDAADAFMRAVEGVCDSQVRGQLDDARERGDFNNLDWFGADGLRIGRDIVTDIENRVRTMVDE